MRINGRTGTGAIVLGLMTLALSCRTDTRFHSYRPVQPEGWDSRDTVCFSLPSTEHGRNADCQLGIRHLDSYPYRDLWLTANGDTLHIQLADSLGKWIGTGIGELRLFTIGIPMPRTVGDSLTHVRITHIMRHNPLPGIHDVGIRISDP